VLTAKKQAPDEAAAGIYPGGDGIEKARKR